MLDKIKARIIAAAAEEFEASEEEIRVITDEDGDLIVVIDGDGVYDDTHALVTFKFEGLDE